MEDARVTLDKRTKRKYVNYYNLECFNEISTSKKIIQSFVLTHKKSHRCGFVFCSELLLFPICLS